MKSLCNKKGQTLIEALIIAGIMGVIGLGAMALMVGSASCYDNVSTEAFTDMDAVIAMQMIVNDVREAKSVNIIANGERLRVIHPVMIESDDCDYYDRRAPDMANQIDYYVSDSTGVPGHSGDCLWQGKNNNNRRLLKKGVTSVHFEQDTARSVKITIVARNETCDKSREAYKEATLTQRVVYLRNY